ncbi:hypothetical protein BO94DRAFT_584329 [Aspergillus sclerotioniger CBS 115572]|uniref:Glucose receptor Git3 N-terminal domain-containing protein n=1 Tax=Aspergillus sclerotioniger CBS 115572 TaxID=1450535 RepID=A0A317WVC8_9EURO|nr:hypothetical protein BO94DRAFT_584329 [Aspergillus sclerotioniger CBS 115572]PWY90316.1 hypothetical protein BO94DRAFT_584329 [Aspergillus sclerotioniger CBS 115572]
MEHVALSAPERTGAEEFLSRFVLIVSAASMLGSGWVILSFLVVPTLRTFRHQLILGLGVSEFLAAFNVVISTGLNVSGSEIWSSSLEQFCNFNGFMAQTFVVQTDYWILSIGVCTYLILMDHTRAASWMQNHRIILWCVPWSLSLLWAVLGLVIVGYGNTGGWCWFTSDRVRLLANFITRWAIIFVIMCIYTRLGLFLYRSHKAISSDHEVTLETLPTDPHHWQLLDIGHSSIRLHRSPQSLKKVSFRMMIYPTVYAIIWVIPTVVRIHQGTTGMRAPLALDILEKICIMSQGLVDALIYGLNERSWSGWMERLRWIAWR